MIYVDFGSILVPEDNGKQNAHESYTNKYQKYIVVIANILLLLLFFRGDISLNPLHISRRTNIISM